MQAQAPGRLENGYRNEFGYEAPETPAGVEIPVEGSDLLEHYNVQGQSGTAYGGFSVQGYGAHAPFYEDDAANADVVPENYPISVIGANVPNTVQLRSAIIGRPLALFSTSYNFGGVIPPPVKFEDGVALEGYYRAEPLNSRIKTTEIVVVTGGVLSSTTTTSEDAILADLDGVTVTSSTSGSVVTTTTVTVGLNPQFYWSKHAKKVYATQPGAIQIKWRESASSESVTKTYIIASSPDKPERTIYWTENGFNGPRVEVPAGKVNSINIIYNSLVPKEVKTPDEQWDLGVVDFSETDPAKKRYKTFYYDNNLIHAYNVEGRVFVEYLGNPRGDGTSEQKGYEIVNIVKETAPETIVIDLGERVGHKPIEDGDGDAIELEPKVIAGLSLTGETYLYEHLTASGAKGAIYAVKDTQIGIIEASTGKRQQTSNEALIYWMETSVLDLKWPKQYIGYILEWPRDPTKYATYARPDAGRLGSVVSVDVVAGGSGYATPPTVEFTSADGSGASGLAVVNNGKVTGVVVTNAGSGYISTPVVRFVSDSGAGATAVATTENGIDLSLATAVELDSANNPVLVYQDDPSSSQAKLLPGNRFVSELTSESPTNRALIRYTRDEDIWFERVYSQLDPYFRDPSDLLAKSITSPLNSEGLVDTGYENITNVEVVDPETGAILVEGEDFEVDEVTGLITFIEPQFIQSVASLGTLNAGDTVSVEIYLGYAVWSSYGFEGPDWEVSSLSVEVASDGSTLLDNEFKDGSGGYTVDSLGSGLASPWRYFGDTKTWRVDRNSGIAGAGSSSLKSPEISVSDTGEIVIKLRHRHNFSYYSPSSLNLDGGMIRVSINGGAYERVESSAFSAHPYQGVIYSSSHSDFAGKTAFAGKSSGYDLPPVVTAQVTFDAPTLPFNEIPGIVEVDIGSRIEPTGLPADTYGLANPVYVGYIHERSGNAYNVAAYQDPFDVGFDEAAKGAIIGVNNLTNNDVLEVWWYRKSSPKNGTTTAITPTYWPTFVQKYRLSWPADPDAIVLASNKGSDDLPSLAATGLIYTQNDPTLPGFNPNEEHALMLNGRAWALRDDLNRDDSSEPFVLLHYTESDQRPAMKVFKVERGDFDYPAVAGKVLQSPMPLPILPPPLLPDGSLASYEVAGVPDPVVVSNKLESDDASFIHYQKFTWTDRKGILWVYRGPHQGREVTTPTLKMRYFYQTLPGFYYPELAYNQQPPVGTITPYLRRGTPGNYEGDPVTGAVAGTSSGEREEQPLDVTFRPQWPDYAPELRVGETLTLAKLGLPSVRGQSSAELIYQQSIALDTTDGMTARPPSARLIDPTRAKVFHLGATDDSLQEIPASVNTSIFLGKTYFPNLPPHLSGRLYFDPAVGAQGALIFKGLFMDELVGEKYLQLNVMSAADLASAKGLAVDDGSDEKGEWDAAVEGLATTMETFIENPSKLGTFIPLRDENDTPRNATDIDGTPFTPAVGTQPLIATALAGTTVGANQRPPVSISETAEVYYSDTAVDSYAISASGGGKGYVVLAVGNGQDTDFTPAGEPVSLQVFKVNAPLYRGELKVINSANPLDEKLTLQHTGDFAGHPEEYDFEWRYAPPVDGLPPKLYSFVRKLILNDSSSEWSLINNPVVDALNPANDYTSFRSPSTDVAGYPIVAIPGSIVIDDGGGSADNGTLAPNAMLRRTFSASERPLRLFVSMDLGANDGAAIYLNGARVAALRVPGVPDTATTSVPATAPAFDPLPLVFEVESNALVVDDDTDNNIVTVELYTSADTGSSTNFNLRIEGSQEVENLISWLPLGLVPGESASTESTTNAEASPVTSGIVAVEGKNRHTIEGTSILTLTDNWLIMRYRSKDPDNAAYVEDGGWSKWTEPQLAEGWIKRVLAGINPFQQRIKDLFNHETNTSVSLVEQAGKRWEGDIALNLENINDSGLIEIYETVLRRGMDLSINGTPAINYGGANDALLLAAGYLSDLYMILGNEAAADAANSTIAFNTESSSNFISLYGDVATALFSFKGQLASVLEEELSLLRGRDDSLLPGTTKTPIYNRLIWNYTRGIDSGEAIYALNYNIKDVEWDYSINPNNPAALPTDGVISAADAAIAYPQGHGDAYGHYLTALTGYYNLLNNENFTWTPRIEAVLVLGTPVSVDYQDERKFASAASALARTAGQTLDLTYRQQFTASEGSGWTELKDGKANPNTGRTRYWGTDEWASRGGQGAFFNWVTANSLLPAVDQDPNHAGIQKIDRTTVPELAAIASEAADIQQTLDNADARINPLGLASGALSFDISPTEVEAGKTHFEQIFERATAALNNAVNAFDSAKGSTQFLRRQEDSIADQRYTIESQEQAFTNELIEIYGTPYTDDIGPGKTYKQGYEGPDLIHWQLVDFPEVLEDQGEKTTYTLPLNPSFAMSLRNGISALDTATSYEELLETNATGGTLVINSETVDFVLDKRGNVVKDPTWTGRRVSPGRLQTATSNLLLARHELQGVLGPYEQMLVTLDNQIALYESALAAYESYQDTTSEVNTAMGTLIALRAAATILKGTFQTTEAATEKTVRAIATAIPGVVGLSTDAGAPAKGSAYGAAIAAGLASDIGQATQEAVVGALDDGIERLQSSYENAQNELDFEATNRELLYEIHTNMVDLRNENTSVDVAIRRMDQAQRDLYALQAEGDRIQKARLVFRQHAAAIIQGYRTRDFAFRAFRDEALERYNALFDLAARYTYLAARAYDYETGLLDAEGNASATELYEKIVQARALGVVKDGEPQFAGSSAGDPGLSGVLAELSGDWSVVKSRLGFNNPDRYRTTFSLREENFRLIPGAEADGEWKDLLESATLDNILDDPDVRRYAMQSGDPDAYAVPGIVLEFSTTISDGYNFFGKPLAAGDHSFSPTSFATKIRSSGVAFKGYQGMDDPSSLGGILGGIGALSPSDPNLGFNGPNSLSATPYIYLIPAGTDMMRSPPLGDTETVRAWSVQDQAIPLPFNVADSDYSTEPAWVSAASLSEPPFMLRKHQAFRAVPEGTVFNSAPGFTNSRLIGRSVWNTRWKIVIPGTTLLNDPIEGLQIFKDTVKDIELHLETYSYSGN
ncbi:hypothetical protein VDG1235_2723 [Verrucomicrobiia bacterium DG1235]|nr:hypothetical protein VDG1235_2723 [Verrucomicrobiae bacterium DG1235]